jgi:hypothetical protein
MTRRTPRRTSAIGLGCATAVAAAILSLLFETGAAAAKARISWDRASNVKEAALRVAEMQKTRGALGTFKFIADCYKTQTLNENYTRFLESCVVQDIIHSRATAAVYAALSPEQRRETGVPEPELLNKSMLDRVGSTLGQFKVSLADIQALMKIVDQQGMSEYAKARFPGETRGNDAARDGSRPKGATPGN